MGSFTASVIDRTHLHLRMRSACIFCDNSREKIVSQSADVKRAADKFATFFLTLFVLVPDMVLKKFSILYLSADLGFRIQVDDRKYRSSVALFDW